MDGNDVALEDVTRADRFVCGRVMNRVVLVEDDLRSRRRG